MAGGNAVRTPTFRPQTARLLTLILNAIRQTARLEFLDDPSAPTRAGDIPEDQPKDAFWYFMMRRSDQEELARMNQQPQSTAGTSAANDLTTSPPDGTAPAPAADPSAASEPAPANAESGVPTAPPSPPLEVRDFDGNIPMPNPRHLKPAIRPDGTDDWYVHKRIPAPPPVNPPHWPGQPQRRRRPWDRQW
jgi:hypothetical protein